MKNRIYTIIACFLATVIYSCSDVLNQAPDGKISLEEVFGDNDKTMYYLNTCYSGINAKGCLYFFWSRGPVNWCDDSSSPDLLTLAVYCPFLSVIYKSLWLDETITPGNGLP